MTIQEALRELAQRTALQLVAQELQALGAAGLEQVAADTITVEAPRRLALPAAARRGRPPGRTRKTAPPKTRPVSATPAIDLATRRCRRCKRVGTAARVADSPRDVKCRSCGATWALRQKATEGAAAPSGPTSVRRAAREAVAHNRCVACDHTEDAHVGEAGRCLSARCVCKGFRA